MIDALKYQLCALARRWLVTLGHSAVTEGIDKALWEWGVKEGRNRKADCVDLCASLFCVCGRYGASAQKSRDTNDPSGGSHVLVAGIVMISTLGEQSFEKGQRQCTRMRLTLGFQRFLDVGI